MTLSKTCCLSLVYGSLAHVARSSPADTGQITGVVKDPDQAAVAGSQVTLTNQQTKAKATAVTDSQGAYTFPSLQPGAYMVEADATDFKASVSPELKVTAGQTVNFDFALTLAGVAQSVNVSAGTVENAYRVDNVAAGGPLGTTPILDLPYSVNVISRQLIDDTQSRNFKEAAKYLPLVSFQEMQGPEVLRPETRGMQGSNMQNDMKDGMGIAVTTPSALEEYEQIEVVNGLGGPLFGPANPSGMFNFVTKRPTEERLGELELDYESNTVATAHTDLGGRFGKNKMFGYRTNLLVGDGNGYVTHSQLRRQLASVAGDIRATSHTTIEGNYSYYNVWQHGYPGWFAYSPTTTPPSTPGSKSILIPEQAPDPTREGYGQSFSGVNLTSQIGELRVKHDFNSNWHLVVGALHQIADRNINTAVNQLVDNSGDYKSYTANAFSSLAPQFQVVSDLAYVTGSFHTGKIRHDVSFGTTGYRFASWSPVTSPAKTALCTAQDVCQANIADPLIDVDTRRADCFPIRRPARRPESTYPVSSISRDSASATNHAHAEVVPESRGEPGLDLDQQLHRHISHRLFEDGHPRRVYQSGSQPYRQYWLQTARGHDDLRQFRRQHSGAGCRRDEHRNHHSLPTPASRFRRIAAKKARSVISCGYGGSISPPPCSGWTGRLQITRRTW